MHAHGQGQCGPLVFFFAAAGQGRPGLSEPLKKARARTLPHTQKTKPTRDARSARDVRPAGDALYACLAVERGACRADERAEDACVTGAPCKSTGALRAEGND